MNFSKITAALTLATALSIPAFSAFELPEKNSLMAKILIAADEKDAENPAFEEAIEAKRFEALAYLGQIGGAACEKLVPFLRSSNPEARHWAAVGAKKCQDTALKDHLFAALERADAEERSAVIEALGFSGGLEAKPVLAEAISTDEASALFALLQAVAYDSTEADTIEGLDVTKLLEIVTGDQNTYAAAYVLARLQGVPEVLPFETVAPVYTRMLDTLESQSGEALETTRLMTRVMREYGDASGALLMRAVGVADRAVREEAIRSMGRLSDADSLVYLKAILDASGPSSERHLAADAIGQRSLVDPSLANQLVIFASDEDPWIATTAARWLVRHDPQTAVAIAVEWLGGSDYYLAYQAFMGLAASDEGKAILQQFVQANPDTVRGREIARALDPSIEGAPEPRRTPSYATLKAYQNRSLVLETTRGNVCISMTGDAPFAATNFLQLADVGKMDGMLWHRVIPNFVTQAGQIEDPEISKWGTIREEWGGEHRVGTVGVATAGRDTGTVQFFINTGYNMHLNNRYTVFGEVYGGMDVVYDLQEGDKILRARTERGLAEDCK